MSICAIENCGRELYAKNACFKHYRAFRRYGSYSRPVVKKSCSISGCDEKYHSKGFCSKHYYRMRRTGTTGVRNITGALNWRWNGGLSQYQNHSMMKKQRKYLIEQYGKCQLCEGTKNLRVHHKDRKKDNQSIDNLILVCSKCHGTLHREKRKTSIFIRKYGMSAEDLRKNINLPLSKIRKMHKMNTLEELVLSSTTA